MSPSGCLTPPGSFDNPAIDMDLVGLEVQEGWTLAGVETSQEMLICCQKENPCTPALGTKEGLADVSDIVPPKAPSPLVELPTPRWICT